MSSASACGFFFLAFVTGASAVVTGPYVPDSATVHLFHLDESTGATSAANSASGGNPLVPFNGANIVTGNAAQPTHSTLFGFAGASKFGKAANIANGAHGLGLDANGSGGFQPGNSTTTAPPDAVAHSTLAGSDGSFTLEALINIPSLAVKREIISTDSSLNNRCFQFYTSATGTIEFNFIGGSGATAIATIPTSGPHAFAANQWFHVAYVFNGTTSVSTFYWTRLAENVVQANALATSGVEAMVPSFTGPLVIGNEGRGASGESLLGLIDEVRISRVARSASEFVFSSDDSDGDGLSDTWEISNFGNLTQSASGDPDEDGYDNKSEELAGSNPNLKISNPGDLDSDGLPDAWEILHFGNATSQNGSGDLDGDFANHAMEHAAGTGPNNPSSWPDTDKDGMNDGWEMVYFSDLVRTGTADSDGDASSDKQEHDANSHPLNPQWSPSASQLAHRWSFNGSLADSSGGVTATIIDPDGNPSVGGSGVLSATNILLGGGPRGTSSCVRLGNGGLIGGRRTPVTIELWATPVSIQNWARIFDFGNSTSEYLFMSWTRGTTLSQDQVRWADGVSEMSNDTVAPYTLGVPWHMVMTLEPRAGVGATTRVHWYASPASGLSLGAPKGTFDTHNTLWQLVDSFNDLGRSQFTADNTANARYDEVRIWNGALTSFEREAYHAAGPEVTTIEDTDDDGLPDAWEILYFTNLSQAAEGDFDNDLYTNITELVSSSDPTRAVSTPADLDADGLADSWETRYFGNLAAAPASDPDVDGESNAIEQSNKSAPNNRASTSSDSDSDGLPDAWERSSFSNLDLNAGADPDGDGFANLQEFSVSSDPINPASRPPGTPVKLVPLDDGDHSTSEFGYGGSSAINSVAFVRSSIKTVGNQQFITWYGRHQLDASAAFNNTLWIGRRYLGSSEWEVFRHPTFTANDITDGHDVISYGIDGDGFMHLSWGMHGDQFHYSRSMAPVTGDGPISLGPDVTMTGLENAVTYPQFLKLPNGDLLFIFREGASGNGDVFINRYSLANQSWSNVLGTPTAQFPIFKGTGWSPNYNAYLNLPQLGGPDGDDLIITWCWRYSSGTSDSGSGTAGYQTNNQLNFARSTDAGLTWRRSNGTPYVLPINRDAENGIQASKAEVIMPIPENSSLINQASTCLDANDNPVTCTWWAPDSSTGNHRRQYRVVFKSDNGTADPSDDSWQARSISNRTSDPTNIRYAENHVRDLGRPIVVADEKDRVIVAYRDNQTSNLSNADASLSSGNSNGITIVHSLPKAQDPQRLVWVQFDLTQENLGNYEPIIDNELWDREQQLHFLYQPAQGQGYIPPSNLATRFSVLEWDAASYFSHNPQPVVALSADQSVIIITCPSQPSWGYRLWSSTDLGDWSVVETRAGTGSPLVFTQAAKQEEAKRFWRIEYREGGFN